MQSEGEISCLNYRRALSRKVAPSDGEGSSPDGDHLTFSLALWSMTGTLDLLSRHYTKTSKTSRSLMLSEASGQSLHTLDSARDTRSLLYAAEANKSLGETSDNPNRADMPSDRDQLLEFGFEASRVDCLSVVSFLASCVP